MATILHSTEAKFLTEIPGRSEAPVLGAFTGMRNAILTRIRVSATWVLDLETEFEVLDG